MTPNTSGDYARESKRAARDGLRTEFLPVETVRTMPWKCDEHRAPKPTDPPPR